MTTVVLRRTELARPGQVAIVYYLVVVAASIVAAVIAPIDLGPTLIVATIAWAAVTGPIMPPLRLASRGYLAGVTVTLAIRNYPDLPPAGRFWAAAAIAVCLSVFILQPMRKVSYFPYLQLFCAVQAIYLYVSLFVATPTRPYRLLYDPAVRTQGFMMMALFMAMVVGASVVASAMLGTTRTTPVSTWSGLSTATVGRAYVLILAGFGGYVAVMVLNLAPRLGSLTNLIQLIGFGGVLMLLMLWLDRRLPTHHKFVVLGICTAFALFGLGLTAIYLAALPAFVALGLYMAVRRAVPIGALMLAVAITITLNMVKSDLRQDLIQGQVSGATGDVGITYLERTSDAISSSGADDVASAAYRYSTTDMLGYMGTWVPDRYPFFGYQVYTSVPYVLVPRLILPDKPKYNWANVVGREYELLSRHDLETSLNTPLATEAFVAGGYPVLVGVGIGVGVFLALLGWMARARTPAMLTAGSLICYSLTLSIESGILYLLLLVPYLYLLQAIMRWATHAPANDPIVTGGVPRREGPRRLRRSPAT